MSLSATEGPPAVPAIKQENLRLRMLLPFLIAMAILLGTFWVSIRDNERKSVENSMATTVEVVKKQYRLRIEESNALMISLARVLTDDEGLRDVFEARDRQAVFSHVKPVYNTINEQNGVSHLYFIGPDRKVLLRVHRPGDFGDVIQRQSFLEAERTGNVTTAIEQGPAGTYILRVVTPWKNRGKLIGYVELGIELTYVMKRLHDAFVLDLMLVESKYHLDREKWRLASLGYGRLTSWDRHQNFVIMDSTISSLPPPLLEHLEAHALEEVGEHHLYGEHLVGNYEWNGRHAQVVMFSLSDLKEHDLGDLVVIEDMTVARTQVMNSIQRIMLICGSVVAILTLFLYLVARKVEHDLNEKTQSLKAENLERQKAEMDLLATQQDLEKRVEQRTKELAEINSNLQVEIAERTKAQESVHRQQSELRVLFDLMPALIWFKDTKNNHVRVNQRAATAAGRTVEELEGHAVSEIYPDQAEKFYADDMVVISSKKPKLGIVEFIEALDGESKWIQTDKVPYFDDAGNVIGIVVMAQDITERKRSEQQLENTQKKLLEVSRQSGMAEVATSVLHNVGNVLNSVNVATTLVSDRLKNSKTANIAKVATLFDEHKNDLARFLTEDPRGKQLPAYLATLAKHLADEQEMMQVELRSLQKNVEHIKDIVAMQQSYAKVYGVTEVITATELVEDALHLNAGALVRHEVDVVREYEEVPPMAVEKHKVLQILVNLIRNAKYACDESGRSEKFVILKVAKENEDILIVVEDNGVGIPEENLERIFGHGFTTRVEGHGFGLHNSALVARELGGSLQAYSEGLGKGARFTLRLPLIPPSTAV